MIIVFCLTCTFLSGISSIKGQTNHTQYADSLFHIGLFSDAAIEYERIYFLSNDTFTKAVARINRCQCLKQLSQYTEAASELNEVALYGLPDSLQQEIRYEIALNSYLSSDFETAKSLLGQVHHYAGSRPVPDKMLFLEILTYNQLTDYEDGLQLALQWINALKISVPVRDSITTVLKNIYNPKHRPRITSEKKSSLYSTIIPGSGQIYAGFAGEGTINFLLSAIVLSTGVYAFIEGYYITGYIVSAGLLQKLYFGNIHRASILSSKGNYLRAKAFNDKIRVILLDINTLAKQQ